ncbi:MAG TPA: hypothetical protein VJN71_03260 [Nitrososphaerales archaeon]|nr:hypothetical protein [Nitrososphaerales archaeon]
MTYSLGLKKMPYRCAQCNRNFENEGAANLHEQETGHRVELLVGSTYWGAHLVHA